MANKRILQHRKPVFFRFLLQSVLALSVYLIFPCSTYAQPFDFWFDPREIPEGKYVYAGYDLETKKILFAAPRREIRNGGHYVVMKKLTGSSTIPAPGHGKVVGFGVYKEGDTIYLSRGGCKAGGYTGNGIGTVNPALPKVNKTWMALMPAEYGEEVLTAVAKEGHFLKIDEDVLGSHRFVFNAKKHDPMTYKLALQRGMFWLPDVVRKVNQERNVWYRLAAGHYTEDLMVFGPGDTMSFDKVVIDKKKTENVADAYRDYLLNSKERTKAAQKAIDKAAKTAKTLKPCTNPKIKLTGSKLDLAAGAVATFTVGGHGPGDDQSGLFAGLGALWAYNNPAIASRVSGWGTLAWLNWEAAKAEGKRQADWDAKYNNAEEMSKRRIFKYIPPPGPKW